MKFFVPDIQMLLATIFKVVDDLETLREQDVCQEGVTTMLAKPSLGTVEVKDTIAEEPAQNLK